MMTIADKAGAAILLGGGFILFLTIFYQIWPILGHFWPILAYLGMFRYFTRLFLEKSILLQKIFD